MRDLKPQSKRLKEKKKKATSKRYSVFDSCLRWQSLVMYNNKYSVVTFYKEIPNWNSPSLPVSLLGGAKAEACY